MLKPFDYYQNNNVIITVKQSLSRQYHTAGFYAVCCRWKATVMKPDSLMCESTPSQLVGGRPSSHCIHNHWL